MGESVNGEWGQVEFYASIARETIRVKACTFPKAPSFREGTEHLGQLEDARLLATSNIEHLTDCCGTRTGQ
jgi:hypothetical protein